VKCDCEMHRRQAIIDRRVRHVSVRCPACGAAPGRPCIGRFGRETVGIHVDRKDAYRRGARAALRAGREVAP